MVLDSLCKTFKLRHLELRNRFVMAPMSRYTCPGAIPNEDLINYYRRRAGAQVGLIVTGAAAIDRPAANNSPVLADFRPASHPMWKLAIDGVHEEGGAIALQLWHAGALYEFDPDYHPAPRESPSGLCAASQKVGEPMTEEAISEVIAEYGRAAAVAKNLGFDAIEIHAAHGFLLDQFFWVETNRRTDRWGGPRLRDRTRFPAAVVQEVRRAVGPEFPLSVRISQWKEQDYDACVARNPSELEDWVEPLADAGADLFSCSQRRWWEPQFTGSGLNLAGWVKKVAGKPTITVGSVGLDVEVMAFFAGAVAKPVAIDALAKRVDQGEFDLVAVGRALLADPCWVTKVLDGRYQEIKPFDKTAKGTVY